MFDDFKRPFYANTFVSNACMQITLIIMNLTFVIDNNLGRQPFVHVCTVITTHSVLIKTTCTHSFTLVRLHKSDESSSEGERL